MNGLYPVAIEVRDVQDTSSWVTDVIGAVWNFVFGNLGVILFIIVMAIGIWCLIILFTGMKGSGTIRQRRKQNKRLQAARPRREVVYVERGRRGWWR